MALLSREQILQHDDLQKELVSVPEWGGEVWVRAMTGAEKDRFEILMAESRTKHDGYAPNLRATLASLTVCDAQGGRLFSVEEAEALGEKSSVPLDRIWLVASRINHLTQEEMEKLEGNFETSPNIDSGLTSP